MKSQALPSNWRVQRNQNFRAGMNLMYNLVWPLYFIIDEFEA